MAKRLFDLCFSALALVLLGPVLLILAVWVRLDSPGPALFRQERIGRHGRPFRVWKFRTMVAGAPAQGPALTIGADPRITRPGVWLRRTKLDELPQFVNVLCGDMSVVGPRPEVPEYVACFPDEFREVVLSVRPGITDPASLAFRDESSLLAAAADPQALYREQILPRKLQMAADYVRRQSLWLDVKIIVQTVAALARAPARVPTPGGPNR